MQSSTSRISPVFALLFLFAVTSTNAAQLAEAQSKSSIPVVLGRGPENTQVTSADVMAELSKTSAQNRQQFLAKPEMVQQMVNNLLVRRVLASQAVHDGLNKEPVLAAALDLAHDRVLSDARLAALDAKNAPKDDALDAYAHSIYQLDPSKFEQPAMTHARHILLDNKGPESLAKAKELLKQLKAGASFEELAKANSTDSGSAAKGGDLGFFSAGKMVKPFEEALDKLTKPGELSEPVETQFGYHIIRLDGRQEKAIPPYSEVQDKLKSEARGRLLNESRVQLVQELNKNFAIDTAAIEALGKTKSQ